MEWKDRLTALASKAYQRQNGKTEVEPFAVMFAPDLVLRVAAPYVRPRHGNIPSPNEKDNVLTIITDRLVDQ